MQRLGKTEQRSRLRAEVGRNPYDKALYLIVWGATPGSPDADALSLLERHRQRRNTTLKQT